MHMTHMDIFCYPVWDDAWLERIEPGKPDPEDICADETYRGKEHFVLFDYEKRDPLTYEALYSSFSVS